ncbi:hypothetical protein [Nocardioides aestuarii]|uniref:Gram-positive cocci surface proteins LPxTG domain-containing protein n=1 Tax=Nocardioides aestuarii TaxID=252231 RepID=A0ABW4TGN4_9ACTN
MSTRLSKSHVFGAGLAALALGAVAIAPGAVAADDSGDVDVVNTETVQVYINSDGEIERQSVYEQLSFTGDGTVDVANPVETDGLRNLDGFGGVSAEDGVQDVSVTVDGYERLRSVSDYTGDLPLEFDITYLLDGEEIEPGDLVGKSGELEVVYTVRNVTAQPQEVSFPDGKGGTMTETVDVPIPIVGSMALTVPPSFTDVTSEQANIAGDGKGGTKLSFTMTLFPPLGSDEMEFSYKAQVSDAVVPATSVTALPVNPLEVPTFKTAGDSYQSGSDTGIRLTEGATLIDENLLKLRDGAAQLLDGLIQLSDGGDQLAAGLAGEAAPGARELADGLGQIDDGAGQLADGSQKASSGSQDLEAGLGKISGGLDQLSAVDGLPKALDGVKQLRAGMDQIVAGFGSTTTPDTLLYGLDQLESGLPAAVSGANQLKAGLNVMRGEDGNCTATPPTGSGLSKAKCGVDAVKSRLDGALAGGGSLDQLAGGLESLRNFCDADEPACEPTINGLQAGVTQNRTDLTQASGVLGQVSSGLEQALFSLDNLLIPGMESLQSGLEDGLAGAQQLNAGAKKLAGGSKQVRDGLAELQVGLTAAVSGVFQLADGAGQAYDGSGDLADGLGRLADGAGQLADGTGQASDGAGQLADGLGDAADGSERLADGLSQAEDGAPQLVDGAGRLSTEGMSQLIEAGEDTAQDYGKLYATIKAGADRADAEKMAYGAPEGAQGLTAYSYELLGDDGQGSRNTKRGVAALALLGAGAGGLLLRRRLA